MKLAIMQPYLFPYIGYYQLVAASDLFIFYDDVNYIKGGWINRNRLIISGAVKYFTMPLGNASSFSSIMDIEVSDSTRDRKKILDSIKFSYSKTPYFSDVFPLVEKIISTNEKNLSKIAQESVTSICKLLEISTQFAVSSQRYTNNDLSSVDRVLDICKVENAETYINLPGGSSLYDKELFLSKNVKLDFVKPNIFPYPQTISDFQPGLSIIDIMMNVGIEKTKDMVMGIPG
ncbi:WbqC family protein [Pantoea sp.]|uniref:WbqC family protein n=1 Tax=Pantoea sp. TaxID=69393 RepID=UPI0028AD7543|nr:WbqC family protein [Pantoea sp.]